MARAQAVVGRIEREHGAQALQAHLPIPADLFSLSDPVNDGNNNPDDEEEERPRVENVGIVQLAFNGAFTFDIALVSGPDADAQAARALFNQFEATSQGRASDFERQLSATFPLPGTGLPPQSRKLASYVFSNLLGGIGYFHGTSIENRMPETEADTFEWEYYADPDDEDAEEQLAAWRRARAARKQVAPATSLLTGTPSRSFFPRGFFWDEGFHLELVARWDSRLAARIVESWLATQDKATGWIAREQILGDEARSRVPDQFQEQAPHIANPPTLIMGARAVVDAMVTSSSGANGLFTDPNTANTATTNGTASAADTFIAAVVPGFYKHWQWLHKSQSGIPDDFGRSIGSPHVYRWRGRTERHNFASGLDDYPRADPPSIGELHLDLTAWMAWYARELAALARRSQAPGFRTSPATERMLLDLDTAADRASAHVRDVFWEPLTSGNTGSGGFGDLAVTASEDASYVHVRKGYVSLLPWILDLVPAATHPEQHAWSLALVRDLARGGHGAQSLHRDDEVYGQGEDYWRGSVWINWQYMVLRALHRDTARRVPGAKDLYDSVRADVLKTVADGYANTGFVHENYHGETGAPRGSHPFTGWTSLVLLIMSEQY
ncbi:glycoside hydrolase [Blastocladiella britannica]|nr:glycoside hydrolase [Blastocladiella britannica]